VDEGEFTLTIGNLRITGDIDPDDVIDEWTHPIALRPGLSLDVKPFTGAYSIATWRAGFSVKCSRGYFGSECEGVCNLPDRGRFICLDSDTFECEEGWRGQSCDDCIPATGCCELSRNTHTYTNTRTQTHTHTHHILHIHTLHTHTPHTTHTHTTHTYTLI